MTSSHFQPSILAFSGSSRKGSYNQKLLGVAVSAARSAGATVNTVDLRELNLPLFDEDLEESEGMPAGGKKLKEMMKSSDGFLIASPEYNSSITPLLKNAIDWASRTESDDEPSLVAFRGKTAAIMSASPGGLGGLRGLVHVRSILGNIGVIVLPDQVSISSAHEAFEDSGSLKDARKQKQVESLAQNLTRFLIKIRN
jgi:chromate reductase, NAD(P)H dehydrogenase (quinone)